MKTNPHLRAAWFAIVALGVAATATAQQFDVHPDREGGVYRAGETVRWTVSWDGDSAPPAAHYAFKLGGLTVVDEGELTLSDGTTTLESTLAEPDTMLLEVSWEVDGRTRRELAGAVASPEKIRAAAEAPADFDQFWAAKIAELTAVPANPRLTPGDAEQDGVEYWKITMDNIRGAEINGQIARPAGGDDLPALLIVQWAGVYGLQKSWAVNRAAEGWLTLNILPHDLPIDESPEFYREQRAGPLSDYAGIGADDREESYFLRMYLSCYRAVEYLKTRPDWNGKTLVVMGTSQGGQQTLVTAGLHPQDITAALALVPAGADMLSPENGRAPAFPRWYYKTEGRDAEAVRQTSRYFDAANFASRIQAPVLIGLGLEDVTCPPATIYAAANRISSQTEVVVLPVSGHQNVNGSQEPYNERAYQHWLPALRRGDPPPTTGRWVATWSTAQQLTEDRNEPPAPQFTNATVRQRFLTSIGGDALRLRFSNTFGDRSITIDEAAIAEAGEAGAIVAGTSRSLTFGGKPSVTIGAGSEWLADPIDWAVEPMAHLAVTIKTATGPEGITGHPGSRTTSYFSYGGEPVDALDLTSGTPVEHWYYIDSLDVWTEHPSAATISILGDSITDGRGSTTNGNDRWPDVLSERLRANPATAHIGVLNHGIGGNQVLRNGLGPNMVSRIDRDVIAQPGVKWMIILEGINDLGNAAGARARGGSAATADDIIAAFDQAITRAHARGIRAIGATIMPYGECFYWSEQGETDRQAINDWIRHSGRFDGVIDFDRVARDPAKPSMLRPDVDSGDHLHLSAAGLRTIAEAIDLRLFED